MVKSWYNLQSRNPSLHFSFLNSCNFLTIFCRVLKIKIFFKIIPSYPPPFAVRNSLTNQFYPKNWSFWIFQQKSDKFFLGPFSTFQFCIFFFLFWNFNFLVKLLVNDFRTARGRGDLGIFKKKYIFKFSKLYKKR